MNSKRLITAILLLLLLITAVPVRALAAGSVTAEIPFTVNEGYASGKVVMRAEDVGAPAPEQAEFSGVTSGTFKITFTAPGDYAYRIFREEADDDTVYRVVVSVFVNETTGDLIDPPTITIKIDGIEQKPDNVEFPNTKTDIKLTKTAKRDGEVVEEVFAGDVVTYEITVENIGNNPARNVEVVDTLPTQTPALTVKDINDGGVKSSDGKTITWTLSEVPAKSSQTVRFTVIVPDVSASVNWVNNASATFDNPVVSGARYAASASISMGVPTATIVKEQALGSGTSTKERIYVSPGDKIHYFITVRNTGTGTAKNVVVEDQIPLPPSLELVAGSISDNGTEQGGTITWNLGDLAPGASWTVHFTATVPSVTTTTVWTNKAELTFEDGSQVGTQGAVQKLAALFSRQRQYESNAVEAVYVRPGDPNVPKTGDGGDPGLWLALLSASVLGLGAAAYAIKSGRKRRG